MNRESREARRVVCALLCLFLAGCLGWVSVGWLAHRLLYR
jgi:hypothetical protein